LYVASRSSICGKNLEKNPKYGQRKAKVEYIFNSDAKDLSGLLKHNPAESVDAEPADIRTGLKP